MKKIDVKTWKRRVPYENFIGYTNPIFSLATRLDVTDLYNRCKREKTSLFADFLFLAVKCLNSVEELRIRISGDEVVMYDTIDPSFIVMTDEGVIVTCRSKMCDSYAEFYKGVRTDIERAKAAAAKEVWNFDGDVRTDLFFISCMPWVELTAVSNPYNLSDRENSSVPRLTWSKIVDENGRKIMTMDIAAHHALVDGEPVCRAFIKIQEALNDVENFFK